MKNITEKIKELKENNLTVIAIGDSYYEYYVGLRQNIIYLTDDKKEFLDDKNSGLIIQVNDVLNKNNIDVAYSFMILQKISLPNIL